MARKINVKLILELRDARLSRSMIASTRHISRHSVSEVFNIADGKGIFMMMSAHLRNRRSIAFSIRKSSRTRPCMATLITTTYIRN